MKKIYIILLASIATAALSGCTKKQSPEEITGLFLKHVTNMEWKEAKLLCTSSTQDAITSWETVFDFFKETDSIMKVPADSLKKIQDSIGKNKIVLINSEVSGDTATCRYLLNKDTVTLNLLKENRQWKINIPELPEFSAVAELIKQTSKRFFNELISYIGNPSNAEEQNKKDSILPLDEKKLEEELLKQAQEKFVFDPKINRSNPEVVSKKFINYSQSENLMGMAQLSTPELRKHILLLNLLMSDFEKDTEAEFEPAITWKKIEEFNCVEEGTKATCTFKASGAAKTLSLIKLKNNWFVESIEE